MLAHHRIAHLHALGGADVGEARVGEWPSRVEHDPARDHGDGRIGLQAEDRPVAGVHVLERDGGVAPALEFRHLLLEPAVLGRGEQVVLSVIGQLPGPAPRRRQDARHGPVGAVEHLAPDAVRLGLHSLAAV